MNEPLRRALGAVRAKDAGAFRQSAFDYLAGHDRAVRLARALHRRLPAPAAHALVQGYGWAMAARTAPPPDRAVVAAAAYRNERRQIDALDAASGVGVGYVDLAAGPRAWARAARLLADAEHRGLMAAATRDDDFLVACRLAETVGRWLALRRLPPGARVALVSSDTNPYAVALIAAAREAGLKVAFVNHGHLPEGPPPLDVDLAILDGPALLDVYRRVGPVRADVVFRGSEGVRGPLRTAGLRPGLRLGVFASLLVDWPTFGRTLERLRAATGARSVLLRLHPNTTIRDPRWRRQLRLGDGDRVSTGDRVLLDDAYACDLVVAGNSSCHLTVLKAGVPTAQVPDLDVVPHDFYRFRLDAVVPWFDPVEALTPQAVADFFADPGWAARFAAYDAGYPDDDGGPARAAAALRRLAGLA